MTTDTVPEARPHTSRQFAERLQFLTDEAESVCAFDLVYGLVGVCQALDRQPVDLADDYETHEVATRLKTAARLLAEQLEARIEYCSPRRALRKDGTR